MQYCENCRRAFNGDTACPACGSYDIRPAVQDDYILLNRADPNTAAELADYLQAENLPYRIEEVEAPELSHKHSEGKAAAVYVRFGDRQAAEECTAALKAKMAESAEEFEDMPPLKRSIVKMVSGILFLILVAVAVIASDYIAEWFIGLFKG